MFTQIHIFLKAIKKYMQLNIFNDTDVYYGIVY